MNTAVCAVGIFKVCGHVVLHLDVVIATESAEPALALWHPEEPLEKVEVFDAQTGTVIVKGSVLIGTVSAESGTVSVRAKESIEPGSGRKEYGMAVELKEGSRPEDTTMVDYDELDCCTKNF